MFGLIQSAMTLWDKSWEDGTTARYQLWVPRACQASAPRALPAAQHPQQVGVGLKPTVCRDTCDAWLSACREEFYSFETATSSAFVGRMQPCTNPAALGAGSAGSSDAAAAASPLLCSRLGDVARTGEELCREAGGGVRARARVRRWRYCAMP